MAQFEYNTTETHQELKAGKFNKPEEHELPPFAKEVPLRTIVKKHGSSVTVEYEWSVLGGEQIRIQFMSFRGKDESLENVHRIKVSDGADAGSFKIGGRTYIIRKTSEDVARELMKTSGKIKASILGVIGYFRTAKGNTYTISKVDGEAWSMDKRLGLKEFSIAAMKQAEKSRFADLIMGELMKLYKQGYALRNFNPLDVIVTKKKIVLGNTSALVKFGGARKVDNFIGDLKVMVRSGIAQKGDVVYGIALSFGAMKKEYSQWAKENGVEGEGDVHVLEKIEESVLRK